MHQTPFAKRFLDAEAIISQAIASERLVYVSMLCFQRICLMGIYMHMPHEPTQLTMVLVQAGAPAMHDLFAHFPKTPPPPPCVRSQQCDWVHTARAVRYWGACAMGKTISHSKIANSEELCALVLMRTPRLPKFITHQHIAPLIVTTNLDFAVCSLQTRIHSWLVKELCY